MGYHLDQSEQIRLGMLDAEPQTNEEMYAEWGGDVGEEDGYCGGVSEEGRAALSHPLARGAYVEGYWQGRTNRLNEGLRLAPSWDSPVDYGGDHFGWPRWHPEYGEWDNYARGRS